jgi:hypothetical protein
MANQETILQQNIRLAIGKLPGVRLFRNNVGMIESKDGAFIHYGLCKGSSDLIGYVSKEITPDMIGQRVALFTAIEIKAGKGKPTAQQQAFIDRVHFDGGISGIARSEQEAIALCQ